MGVRRRSHPVLPGRAMQVVGEETGTHRQGPLRVVLPSWIHSMIPGSSFGTRAGVLGLATVAELGKGVERLVVLA